MKPIPRYTGHIDGIDELGVSGLLYRHLEKDPWSLMVKVDGDWQTLLLMTGRCICHFVTGPCEAAINDTAARILRGDHPDIYKPKETE
jgi:hypothetical protein